MKKILIAALMIIALIGDAWAVGVTPIQSDPTKNKTQVYGDDPNHAINTDADGDLQIDIKTSTLPSGAATEATLQRIDSNVVICNTTDIRQSTHNNLNLNANLQVNDADNAVGNPAFVSPGTSAEFEVIQSDPNTLKFQEQSLSKTPYSIEYAVGAASINFAFGFTSRMVMLWADSANTDDLVIDFLGGTAVVPSADTAGDGRLPPGAVMTIPLGTASVSAIAASGSQTIRIYAFR